MGSSAGSFMAGIVSRFIILFTVTSGCFVSSTRPLSLTSVFFWFLIVFEGFGAVFPFFFLPRPLSLIS